MRRHRLETGGWRLETGGFAGVRSIIFDLGCTLFDETEAFVERCGRLIPLLAERGVRTTTAELMCLADEAAEAFDPSPFHGALRRLGSSQPQADDLMKLVPFSHDCIRVYPGVPEMLESLRPRYKLAVVANQSPGAEDRMRARGIHHFFEFVLPSAELGITKPDPRIFELAEQKAGCRAGQMLMVGDRLDNDVRPAKALGWRTIHVRQSFFRLQRPRNAAETPDAVLDSVADLPALLSPHLAA